jgi:lysophospholipase L1-like esterase
MDAIVKGFKSIGARALVGTPGVVDSNTYRNNPDVAVVYNENLAELAKTAQSVAADNSEYYINLNAIMMDAMKKAKAQLGDKYHVAGGDGVHPAPNGQLVMAYAFLKGMGFDGNIATVDMDFKGKTTVSADMR